MISRVKYRRINLVNRDVCHNGMTININKRQLLQTQAACSLVSQLLPLSRRWKNFLLHSPSPTCDLMSQFIESFLQGYFQDSEYRHLQCVSLHPPYND